MTLLWFSMIGIGVMIMIYISFEHRSQQRRRVFLIIFSSIGVLFYLFYWATAILSLEDFWILLPLQLCDMAVFLMPIGLITQKEDLMDFLFYPCGLGALSAIVLMALMSTEAFYAVNINFFFSHFLILGIPILSILWGLYDPKPSLKKALRLTLVLLGLTALMHGLNLFLNATFRVEAFYFFTIRESGILVSPLLGFFAKVIPYDYFYMILVLPILYLYMIFVYWVRKRVVSGN